MIGLRTTRAKLLGALVPVVLVATAAVTLSVTVSLERFLAGRLETDTAALTEVVRASLQQQMMLRVDLTQRTVEDIAQATGIERILLLDRAGRVVHAAPAAERGRVLDARTDAACAGCHARGAPDKRTAVSTVGGRRILRVALPIENQPRCQGCHGATAAFNGMLLLERDLDAEASLVAAVRTRLGLGGLATAAVVAALAAGLATVVVLRPVQRLIGVARRLGAGDLDARVDVRGRGEIAELGRTLNGMAASLAASIDDIRAKSVELGVLYRLVDHISKSVFIGELKPLGLDLAVDVLHGRTAALVCRATDPGQLEIHERDVAGTVSRRLVPETSLDAGDLPVPAALVRAWLDGAVADIGVDGSSGLAVLPLRYAERDLALLTVERTAGAAGVDDARLVGAVRDHVSVAFENARLYALAITDELTQLYSRRHFQLSLDEAVRRSVRYGEPVALVLLDLDHFKTVNDTYGHPAGDAVLREVAARMRAVVRDVDLPCRSGGEEFAVILPHTAGAEARVAAERLRATLAARPVVLPDGRAIDVTASLGVAGCPADATSAVALVDLADRALYAAKRSGRNRVCDVDAAADRAISRVAG